MDAECDMSDFCSTVAPDARAAHAEGQFAALAAREATVHTFVCHDAPAARRHLQLAPMLR